MKNALLVMGMQYNHADTITKSLEENIESLMKEHRSFFEKIIAVYSSMRVEKYPIIKLGNISGPPPELLPSILENSDITLLKECYSAVKVIENELSKEQESVYDYTWYICGVHLDSCILSTSFAFLEKGVNFKIITDLSASSVELSSNDNTVELLIDSIGKDKLMTKEELKL